MDRIKALLSETGWNCDQLIEKIQEYKLSSTQNGQRNKVTSHIVRGLTGRKLVGRDLNNMQILVCIEKVQNDHSYTCRARKEHHKATQTKAVRKKPPKVYRNFAKKYLKDKKKKKHSARVTHISRKIKRRYRLQRKHSPTDRKMLILKYKSKEGVRNEIMHQLELLRSKRTLGISSDIKPAISDTIFSKKRYSGDKLKESEFCKKDEAVLENGCGSKDLQSEQIVEKETNAKESAENMDLCSIKPTKTNDITKIKGWKNKKFFTPDQNTNENGKIATITSGINSEKPPVDPIAPTTNADPKSAFASSNLDGFLNDSANLHISFDIPTSHSGRNDNKADTSKGDAPIVNFVSESFSQLDDQDEFLKIARVDPLNLYRPRTVGQKRRIWKLRTDTGSKKRSEDAPKPRTLAEKRRMLMDSDMDARNKLRNIEDSGGTSLKHSYVLHRGRKLKIPTRTDNGIIAYIKSHYGKRDYIYVPKKVRQSKIKPSIFATTPANEPQVIRYRPGPLSKKVLLQEYNKEWKTEIKTLPKVYLQVTPELNKPISPKIRHLLPNYGFELTDERVSFALSTMHTNTHDSFEFPVPYANKQEYLLLRRKLSANDPNIPEPPVTTEDNKSIQDTVQTVIDKMLDYVEIKTISEEVVRDDVSEKLLQEDKASVNEHHNNVSKKKKTKQSKTNYELKRLNVKVIEVNLEDKGETKDCKKDFCQLGCVCKSLSTTSSLMSNHCGVPDCMFKCQCNYEKKNKGNLKVTLPIGTDLLSEGAVNRLEVEAKKNLARVEKEFTQTVIQANNQTIVVGGCTNRQRRVTKVPKKYTDFIEDPEEIGEIEQVIDEELEESRKLENKLRNWKPVPCTVFMAKLNLSEVVPYCMVHHLYDCHCDYKALYEPEEQKDESVEDGSSNTEEIPPNSDEPTEDSSPILNPPVESCARTKGIPTDYYRIRNKCERFVSVRKRKLDKLYRNSLVREEECVLKEAEDDDETVHVTEEPELVTDSIVAPESRDARPSQTPKEKEKRTRRKQNLMIRRDSSPILHKVRTSSDNAIQRRKKHKKHISKSLDNSDPLQVASEKTAENETPAEQLPEPPPEQPPQQPAEQSAADKEKAKDLLERIAKFEQIFQTNVSPAVAKLFPPSSLIQDKLSEILGREVGSDVQYRLVPWYILIQKYENDSLKLWYSTYFKKPRIIATDSKTIPKHFVNVKSYEEVPNKSMIKADVVRWIVTRTIPICNTKENVFIIVQLTKTHCELCGLWEKKQDSQHEKMVLISHPVEKTNAEKKMYSIVKKIMFSKCKFSKQRLIERTQSDSNKIPAISAYLPEVTVAAKWRMIRLNSDFSVLSLQRNKYAIKYSDLQKVMKMAKETSLTIVLKTPEVETNYPHPDFGIYASPDCEDIIFVGPYFNNEEHDVTTLRYVNRELIRTDVFCQMKGQKPQCGGVWLRVVNDNVQTIDLTAEGESDSETRVPSFRIAKGTTESTGVPALLPLQSVLQPKKPKVMNFVKRKRHGGELISSSDLLNYESCAIDYTVPDNFYKYVPEEVHINAHMFDPKIYFVPNVPNIGFIVGYQLSNQVVVQWPSMKYVVKFPEVAEAVAYILRELNTYFIRNPSFQITVEVTSEVDFTKVNMFNSDMLRGYYIASPAGVMLLLDINKFSLKALSMTINELEAIAKQRAQRMIFDKCYELVKRIFIPSKLGQPNTTNDLLQMIIGEVRHQQLLHNRLTEYKNRLLTRRQALQVTCTSLIKELQPLVGSKMQSAMTKILNFNSSLTYEKPAASSTNSSNDVICLDADSEEEAVRDTTDEPTSSTVSQSPPAVPKIMVKRIQDLKEPNGSKLVSFKSFSILKNKTSPTSSEGSPNATKDIKKSSPVSPGENSTNLIMRTAPPEATSSNSKTFTIKRSMFSKKCSKFVIKTTNGKYMTIRAEDLKQFPLKKLHPIPQNDPVIPKLNMSTKRIIVPTKANGFVKVNFNDKPPGCSEKIVNSAVENGQQPNQNVPPLTKQT